MNRAIEDYNAMQSGEDQKICGRLMDGIQRALPDAEGRVWHGSPVWFLDGNPIVGYGRLKDGVQLLFWSGATFGEDLKPVGKYKAAEVRYKDFTRIDEDDLARWLGKSREIQWDYKSLAKRQGVLERLR